MATLKTVRYLKIIDFTSRAHGGRTLKGVDLDDREEILDVLDTIGREMAKPVDPESGEIDYVPTQYVAEVVKRAGYHGVAFQSALGPGTNTVLFQKADAEVQ